MSFAPDFTMPGAYRFENTQRAGSALNAGIFRPPVSPSESTYNLTRSTGSFYSDISMSNTTPAAGPAKRKRMNTRESTPVDWNMSDAQDVRDEQRAATAARQFRYTLAGQINATPSGAPPGAENGILEDSVYSDVDYRRALGPKEIHEAESPSVQSGSGMFSPPNPKQSSVGWSALALHTIGDVVGKVWEFCKTGTFRGFHAGGGKGYDMQPSTPSQEPSSQPATQGEKPWCNEHDLPTLPMEDPSPSEAYQFQPPTSTELPKFPQPEFPPAEPMPYSPQYIDINTPDSTPRPAAKRRQVSGHNEELKKNWVMVDEPKEQRPRSFGAELSKVQSRPAPTRAPGYYSQTAASTRRRINAPNSRLSGGAPSSSSTTLPRSRAALRISHAGSPVPSLPPREPASFAAPRSPVHRATPSRIPVPVSQQSPNPFSFAAANTSSSAASRPASRASRPASRQSLPSPITSSSSPTKSAAASRRSIASAAPTIARRRTGTGLVDVDDIQASPRLTAEAKQLAQKKIAAERDTDMRVDAFNARLLSMIRQGKEALGTKVEVDGVGWEDDDDDY